MTQAKLIKQIKQLRAVRHRYSQFLVNLYLNPIKDYTAGKMAGLYETKIKDIYAQEQAYQAQWINLAKAQLKKSQIQLQAVA